MALLGLVSSSKGTFLTILNFSIWTKVFSPNSNNSVKSSIEMLGVFSIHEKDLPHIPHLY